MIRTAEEQYLHELIESYVAPLRNEIKELRKQLPQQRVKNLNIPAVIKSVCTAAHQGMCKYDIDGECYYKTACEFKQTVL